MPGVKIHPREIQLARLLKEWDLEWEVRSGDWFYAQDSLHVVLRREPEGEDELLYDVNGNSYRKSGVLWLPHRTFCIEWLMSNDWEVAVSEPQEGIVRARAQRRKTEYVVEKREPTELAAIYSVLLEVLELTHFGWA